MPNRIGSARREFEQRIATAETFARRSASARHPTAQRLAYTNMHIRYAYETAALKVVVASELFLETTLGLYVMGGRSPSGYRARRRVMFRGSLPKALELFRGDKDFIGWNSASIVIDRAARWLRDGEPYQTALSGASQLLSYLRKMRNAVAHESASAIGEYVESTRRLYGAAPMHISPGHQLVGPPPSGIPYLTGPTLFDAMIATYRVIAQQIAP